MISNPLSFTALNFDVGELSYRGMTLKQARDAGFADDVLLPAVKLALTQAVDAAAEALRISVMTPGAGQAMEYQEAQAQARAALAVAASGKPVQPSDYPMLAVSIGIDIDPQSGAPAADVLGVARSVQAAYDAWLEIGSAIRGVRLAGKKKIEAAADIAAAQAAYDAITWSASAG
ncbi:hypothetical protein [Methylobacterium radiotolerans]|uniref:hypothetical protein n=1 Tax=Methylobacterium radiotolerans TaxID=31998 RepID=UPI001F306C4F|nr:hypothetical protein [Methylobacterium radiotolerans]UIY44148.1 hypothetical protein LZ599_10865 [Methylobacterium radiotolerans]